MSDEEGLLLDRILDAAAPGALAIEETAADGTRRAITYGELAARVQAAAGRLARGHASLRGAGIALLAPPSAAFVESLLAIWHAGAIAVPLSPLHTRPELATLVADAAPSFALATGDLAARVEGLVPVRNIDTPRGDDAAPPSMPLGRSNPDARAPALLLYTSGTTSRPKGVVLSHAALAATCSCLHEAWGWSSSDRLLHVLPLHHTHGLVVALLGSLYANATLRFEPFDAAAAWRRFQDVTVFMGVPTMYARLTEAFDAASPGEQAAWRAAAARVRLFTCGSAALPAALFEAFHLATGHRILERYGMTEIGMALSNPLGGPRTPGSVGSPLPGVSVDVVGDAGPCPPDEPGELRVRSPQVLDRYHGDPAASAAAFDEAGRFRTGDTAVRATDGTFRLLGRTSTDILKSGGYKLSTPEIEEALRGHPAITDVAIVGMPDDVHGERVTACVVLRAGAALVLDDLRAWARERLAPYKLPRQLAVLPELPRNAMGKVQKAKLKRQIATG